MHKSPTVEGRCSGALSDLSLWWNVRYHRSMLSFAEKTLAEQGFAACWRRDVAPVIARCEAIRRRRVMFASLITGIAVGLAGVVLILRMQIDSSSFLAQPVNQALVLALAALAVIGAWATLLRQQAAIGAVVRKAVELHFASLLAGDDNRAFGEVVLQDLIADGVLHDREYRLTAHYAGTYGDCRVRMIEAVAGVARGHRHDRVDLLVFRISLPFSQAGEIRADSRADRLEARVNDRPGLFPYHVDNEHFDGIFAVAASHINEAERIFTPGFVETMLRIQERLASPLVNGRGAQPRIAMQAADGNFLMVIETPSTGQNECHISPTLADARARELIVRFATLPALVDDLCGKMDVPPAFAPLPIDDDPRAAVAL